MSKETPPLYLPAVWHSAQRALSSGSTSWEKSIFFGAWALAPPARAQATRQAQAGRRWEIMAGVLVRWAVSTI